MGEHRPQDFLGAVSGAVQRVEEGEQVAGAEQVDRGGRETLELELVDHRAGEEVLLAGEPPHHQGEASTPARSATARTVVAS
ncbi:hypothetical protein OG977_38660 [Kitasatospora purpeofusca]